jgi:autotransporter strand-loop-strand O-heptosyltransferase
MIYNNIKKNDNIIVPLKPIVNITHIEGPRVEISNGGDKIFDVVFYNNKTKEVEHSGQIGNNCWIKSNKRYFIDWLITVDGEEYRFDLTDKRVYISLDSKSLGDTIAWFPYVEEFRKKHNCRVVCSTFMNHLFEANYPEIEFVKPGVTVHGIIAMYNIGWFYDGDQVNLFRNPSDFKKEPLQKTACDILGLDYEEVVPKLKLPKRDIKKQVAIAIHSTCQAKYWNNPTGWQGVVNYLNDQGCEVVLISKEGDGYMGNYHPTGVTQLPQGDLESVINVLNSSIFFIGIGSGLSWLSWACEIPTVIISGFSDPYTEPQNNVIRIEALEKSCKGCFNKYVLDAGDWMWCPEHKGTDRQFECTRLIEGEYVINKIKHLL